jgi:hypothetical protein
MVDALGPAFSCAGASKGRLLTMLGVGTLR